jgi:hypothetical protein
MDFEKIVSQMAVIYDNWVDRKKSKKNAKVFVKLGNDNEKDRNQGIIKKEAQNKLKKGQKDRCSIVADHNIKGKKIDEYP